LAGLSILIREPNFLLLTPFIVGAFLRRDRGSIFLIIGLILGIGFRLILMWLLYGEALELRGHDSIKEIENTLFGLKYILPHGLFYLGLLTFFIPLGLPAAFIYRGRRWQELIAAVVIFFLLYSSYYWIGSEAGAFKSIILGGRFMIPLIPLLCFCIASFFSKKFNKIKLFEGFNSSYVNRNLGFFIIFCVVSLIGLTQYTMHSWSKSREEVRDLIYKTTSEGSILLLEKDARKYVCELYGDRKIIGIESNLKSIIHELRSMNKQIFIVIHNRYESEFWRLRSLENKAVIEEFKQYMQLEVVINQRITENNHLQILRIK
jgi:hypothetical protein